MSVRLQNFRIFVSLKRSELHLLEWNKQWFAFHDRAKDEITKAVYTLSPFLIPKERGSIITVWRDYISNETFMKLRDGEEHEKGIKRELVEKKLGEEYMTKTKILADFLDRFENCIRKPTIRERIEIIKIWFHKFKSKFGI